jgi:hypothetical protein
MVELKHKKVDQKASNIFFGAFCHNGSCFLNTAQYDFPQIRAIRFAQGIQRRIVKIFRRWVALPIDRDHAPVPVVDAAVAAYLSVQGPRPQIGFLQPGSNAVNPAARLCEEKSGVIKTNVLTVRLSGELKMESFQTCFFADESEIGAWTLWHGKDHPMNAKLTTILESGK